jgi:hypothetical protein
MIDTFFALSCPVCYAPTDPLVRESLNLGILVLLGVLTVVLVGVGRFIVSIAQRSRDAARDIESTVDV